MSHEPAGGRNSLSPQGQVLAGPFPSSEFQVQGNSGTKPLFYAPLNMYHVGLGWIPREDCMYLFHWSSFFLQSRRLLRNQFEVCLVRSSTDEFNDQTTCKWGGFYAEEPSICIFIRPRDDLVADIVGILVPARALP